MKTLLCCIGRLENQYIREYVEYYKNLGFTNICLFDNNKPDEEHFEDVIGDYIDSGFVILKDYRGRTTCQLNAYQECYEVYGKEYDWIAFFDCDEFLTFTKNKTIDEYLSRIIFKKYDMIHVNWMNYGDGDVLTYEDKPLLERITKPAPYDYKCEYNWPENYHIKSIIRGNVKNILWNGNPHTTTNDDIKCCDSTGMSVKSNNPFSPYKYTDAYLRHFSTKTAEEYANKMKRGFPDQSIDFHNKRIKMLIETRFFKTNAVTKEKVDLFKEKLGVDMSYLLPIEIPGTKSEKTKIFSLCYSKKNFKFLDDAVITPLQVGAARNTDDVCELKDNTGQNISNKNYLYIENTGTYWIWKNIHNCKYKGQMQYRRPLEGINERFDFDEAFKNHDVITCKPFNHPVDGKPTKENGMMSIPANTVYEGYEFSNCGLDLKFCEQITKRLYPEYSEDWDKYITNGENLYYSSGYIMREADYDRWCEFSFKILTSLEDALGITDEKYLWMYVGRNLGAGGYSKRYGDNPYAVRPEHMRWQTEIFGFLNERLWTLWLQHNFSRERILELPYVKQEEGMYT